MSMPRFVLARSCVVTVIFGLTLLASGCAGSSSTSPTPTPSVPTSITRVIGLGGNLAFGNVAIGEKASATVTITNTGNAALTVSGMTVPGGVYTSSFTSGTIAAGASQAVAIQFAPSAAQTYNGSLTVNGDQTNGTNTMPISGTGISATPPVSPPATFSVNGAVTYGTSHGILPERHRSNRFRNERRKVSRD